MQNLVGFKIITRASTSTAVVHWEVLSTTLQQVKSLNKLKEMNSLLVLYSLLFVK